MEGKKRTKGKLKQRKEKIDDRKKSKLKKKRSVREKNK